MLNEIYSKMKRIVFFSVIAVLTASLLSAAGYKVGDKVEDFSLENVDGKFVLTNISERLSHLLSVTKLDTIFKIAQNKEEALNSLS